MANGFNKRSSKNYTGSCEKGRFAYDLNIVISGLVYKKRPLNGPTYCTKLYVYP